MLGSYDTNSNEKKEIWSLTVKGHFHSQEMEVNMCQEKKTRGSQEPV